LAGSDDLAVVRLLTLTLALRLNAMNSLLKQEEGGAGKRAMDFSFRRGW